jgi:hypothetical protein
MRVYCPHRDATFAVAKYEITEMSPASAIWIRGFLAGNEPEPDDMFGPPTSGDHDDVRLDRWQAAIDHFRMTGHWWPQPWFPLPDLSTLGLRSLQPYAVLGDERWIWGPGGWALDHVVADGHFSTLKVTECDTRGRHSMVAISEDRVMCDTCGLVG